MSRIPPRQLNVQDKDRRFYVAAPSSVYLKLQHEAITRGTDLWTLGGAVLTDWLSAGCPDLRLSDSGETENSLSPPSSSSPLAGPTGGAE